jgi:hypothetical protein
VFILRRLKINNDFHEFILDSGTVANNRVIFQIFLPPDTWEFFIFFPLVHGNIPWGFYRKSEQFPWLFTTVLACTVNLIMGFHTLVLDGKTNFTG